MHSWVCGPKLIFLGQFGAVLLSWLKSVVCLGSRGAADGTNIRRTVHCCWAPFSPLPAACHSPSPLCFQLALLLPSLRSAALLPHPAYPPPAALQDSRAYAGYETALKDTPFFGGSGGIKVATPKAGTAKKSVAKPAAGTKKGGTMSKFFGKN